MDKQSLPWITKLSYGVGHVFNDLCASMWFTYLLMYYEKVLLFSPTMAGLVLLVGQIADGISTPLVGIFSDKENKLPVCARYGRRKVWHLIGTVLVFVSFPFIYNSCLGCQEADMWAQFAYYCVFVCIFQFGWASVQISHLALIPDLTYKKHQRTELNSIRYAFTVLANLSVFAITFVVLNTSANVPSSNGNNSTMSTTIEPSSSSDLVDGYTEIVPGSNQDNTDTIGPEDATKFRNVAVICCVVGAVFSLVFHVGVREPVFVSHKTKVILAAQENEAKIKKAMRKLDWFKELPFYQVAILYMVTRLYVNLYQVYIPLYVQDTLLLSESYVATVPFSMYLAGFVGSLIMKEINKKIGRKATFTLGCCVGLAGSLWVWYGDGSYYTHWGVFLVAALLGIGGSTLLITSLSITADLIGENVEGGAFVYGFMSLVDKFSNGIIIMVIQNSDPDQSWYYRSVITFACGSACVLGIFVTITLRNVKIGQRHGTSPVLEILAESDDSSSSLEGVDNPVISVISEVKWKPSSCQPGLESPHDLRHCEVPASCQHRTTTGPDSSYSAGLGQLPEKSGIPQRRPEEAPNMYQLGVTDILKVCQSKVEE
nr:major facilitator superfamily domain-containing protein 12-like [Procambarus clarkii]XP_045625268.1 major facilitator superfamily domain-containing protein 12-like [Procambarus clarkii]XP_045625269.1 major facilitator superfamily domain-containing protein 12-like [Procambarus clarkii]XP_045625270.1 major facilitator superfamily domain-containing protein 12-like [Procambarus clarkii]XP_045625271.1 major facilitator superfamily domain-containing protein 12-like [Procambarus clarkii]XP_0456252